MTHSFPTRRSSDLFEQRGKRRLHSKPDAGEIEACRWWLDKERAIIRPTLTIALGATDGRALLGHPVTIGKLRGEVQQLADGSQAWVTVHPSYLLRIRERHRACQALEHSVADLRQTPDIAQRQRRIPRACPNTTTTK